MKRWKKAVLGVLFAAGILLSAGITATVGWRPFIGPRARPLTEHRFDPTPERLERGAYLVKNVAGCLFCHSEMDTVTEGFPVKAGMAGSGRSWAPDGIPFVVAPNITPDPQTGAGTWADDAIARAIREGVGHDGRALFPLMPYANYRQMTDEDLASVIAYIRSLRPVRNELPASEIPFPVNRLINGLPEPIDGPVTADLSSPVKRGHYLVTMGSCGHCHTPMDARGVALEGMDFAGGNTFRYTDKKPVASANLTPASNGIPYYTEGLFLETIRTGRVRERQLSDLMPWGHYRGMTDEDLRAIFAYLQTLAPVEHYVDNTLPPTMCGRCNLEHGGGDKNGSRK
jgi:mono/diheme cytochrome c family protein